MNSIGYEQKQSWNLEECEVFCELQTEVRTTSDTDTSSRQKHKKVVTPIFTMLMYVEWASHKWSTKLTMQYYEETHDNSTQPSLLDSFSPIGQDPGLLFFTCSHYGMACILFTAHSTRIEKRFELRVWSSESSVWDAKDNSNRRFN